MKLTKAIFDYETGTTQYFVKADAEGPFGTTTQVATVDIVGTDGHTGADALADIKKAFPEGVPRTERTVKPLVVMPEDVFERAKA